MKYLLSMLVCAYVSSMCVYGQVVFKGPTEGKPNKMVTVTLDQVNGDDLKLHGFVNGKLADANEYLLFRNEDNQRIIFLLTEKEAVFTFVAAVNKDGKTFLTNHTLTIGTPKPGPVIPGPVTPIDPLKPLTFAEKLKAEYSKSPDAPALSKLVTIYETVSAGNYKSFDDMQKVQDATITKFLPDESVLKTTRALIAEYLQEKLGDDPRRRDVDKGKEVFKEVLTALKTL